MNFEFPAAERIGQLRSLWKEAFGDSDTFLDGFFAYGFSPQRCRCITEKGEVVSALYWFEGTCRQQRFAYLYAVATAKKCRGRGLFSALLADVKQVLAAEGFHGILLVPENEALARMYEKFGFSPCTTVDTVAVKAGSPVPVREIGAEEFAALRRSLLPAGAVVQEGATLDFLASQYHFWAGDRWLAIGQVYEGKLVCQEFLGDRQVMAGLVAAVGAEEGSFRVPGEAERFAYLLKLQEGCAAPDYFALALD